MDGAERVVVWLGSYPDRLTHDRSRLRLSNVFGTPEVMERLAHPPAVPVEYNRVHGWVEVTCAGRWSQLKWLHGDERHQVRQWALLLGRPDPASISEELVFFHVSKFGRFEERPQIKYHEGGNNRGSVVQLSGEFQTKLLDLHASIAGPPERPYVCVRLPAEMAALITTGRGNSFCLPDSRQIGHSLAMRWHLLGLLPAPPVVLQWTGEVDLRQNVQQDQNKINTSEHREQQRDENKSTTETT